VNINNRLNKLYESAPRLPFDNRSKLVLFSDCHRGEGSWADNFAKNQALYYYALNHYYDNGFTYIELGDGDELWENKKLQNIVDNYKNIYRLFSRFYCKNRLHMLYGNHDIVKKSPKNTKCLDTIFDSRKNCTTSMCPDLHFYESLVLKHRNSDTEILLIHGHQADFFNYDLWMVARFLVRYLWKPLEMIGVHDPTSAAKNNKKRISIERKLISWVKKEKRMLIAGHTHRPVFPSIDEPPYFNDGSCVHPRCVTCIEIDSGEIMLVKWAYYIRKDGTVYVGRELLEAPRKLIHDD
jgi:UDP-2,3-diacylglucosamine pyrophosphatase LpxH